MYFANLKTSKGGYIAAEKSIYNCIFEAIIFIETMIFITLIIDYIFRNNVTKPRFANRTVQSE